MNGACVHGSGLKEISCVHGSGLKEISWECIFLSHIRRKTVILFHFIEL